MTQTSIRARTARAMTSSSRAGIDLDRELSEEAQPLGDRTSDVGTVLAHASREREHVEPAEGHRHLGDRSGDPVRVDREPERVVEPAQGGQPRFVLERVVEFLDSQSAFAEQVDQGTRVDRPGPSGHGHALERAEAHRRVDRSPFENGCHRAAPSQMANDESHGLDLGDNRLHRDAVEPIPAYPPLFAPALWHGVGRSLLGHGRVKARVEDRDVRHVRKRRACFSNRTKSGLVVERGDPRDLLDRGLDLLVDPDGIDVSVSAVNDAVADSRRRHKVVDLLGRVSFDEVELEARGAGVDGEDRGQALSRARSSRAPTARRRRARASRPGNAGAPRPCPASGPPPGRQGRARGR